MPNSPKTVKIQGIQKLIDEVMPQLSSFVAGRRGSGDDGINDKIVLLRRSLEALDDVDRKKFISQSVHGNNPGGAVFSGIEKATGLKLSTSLGDAIKRYYDEVIREPAVSFSNPLTQEMAGEAVSKPDAAELATADKLFNANVEALRAGNLPDYDGRSKEIGEARTRADDAATKIQAAFRKHKANEESVKTYNPFSAVEERVEGENPMYTDAPVVNPRKPMSEADKKRVRTLEGYRNSGLPTSSKKSSVPSTPEAVAVTPPSPEVREPVESVTQSSPPPRVTLAESASKLLKRIADRPGKEAEILRARVREGVENITPSPSPGKPVGGKSTHR